MKNHSNKFTRDMDEPSGKENCPASGNPKTSRVAIVFRKSSDSFGCYRATLPETNMFSENQWLVSFFMKVLFAFGHLFMQAKLLLVSGRVLLPYYYSFVWYASSKYIDNIQKVLKSLELT